MRVILQQMDIVFKCKGKKDGDIGRVNEGVKESTLVFSTLGLHIRLDMVFFLIYKKNQSFKKLIYHPPQFSHPATHAETEKLEVTQLAACTADTCAHSPSLMERSFKM